MAVVGEVVLTHTASRGRGWDGETSRVSTGADTKANTRGGSALERGQGAPLEPLAQLGDALGGVGAVTVPVEATELVAGQTAKGKRSVNGR